MNDLKERYLSIQKIIRTHDYEYYILDDSKISDQEYDELFRELRQIESENPDWITPESPSQRVGIKPESDFATFKHFQQMLSLANAFNEEDLRNNLRIPALNLDQDLLVSDKLIQTQRVMVKDEDVCLHCGLCAERCPTGAWDMQTYLYEEAKVYS